MVVEIVGAIIQNSLRDFNAAILLFYYSSIFYGKQSTI